MNIVTQDNHSVIKTAINMGPICKLMRAMHMHRTEADSLVLKFHKLNFSFRTE